MSIMFGIELGAICGVIVYLLIIVCKKLNKMIELMMKE